MMLDEAAISRAAADLSAIYNSRPQAVAAALLADAEVALVSSRPPLSEDPVNEVLKFAIGLPVGAALSVISRARKIAAERMPRPVLLIAGPKS